MLSSHATKPPVAELELKTPNVKVKEPFPADMCSNTASNRQSGLFWRYAGYGAVGLVAHELLFVPKL